MPAFVAFDPTGDPAASIACRTELGTGGCDLEQPFEAVLRALSPPTPTGWTAPGYETPSFPEGVVGRGGSGFLRGDAVLAVVILSDEDDCSVRDAELVNPASATYASTPLNQRCTEYDAEALHPIERFIDGLSQLRQWVAEVVFVPIVGIPPELVSTASVSPDWDRLTAEDPRVRDERMFPRPHPTTAGELAPACVHPERGEAAPGLRFARAAQRLQALGALTTIRSICEDSFDSAMEEIATLVRVVARPRCMPIRRALRTPLWDPSQCDVLVVLPEGTRCTDVPATTFERSEGGREVCRLAHLDPSVREPGDPVPPGDGWYRDLTNEHCSDRIALTLDLPSAETWLVCFTPIPPRAPEVMGRGTPCGLERPVCEELGLACDPLWGFCNVPCTTDADCAAAGFPTFVCDRRELRLIDPLYRSSDTTPYDTCVDPMC